MTKENPQLLELKIPTRYLNLSYYVGEILEISELDALDYVMYNSAAIEMWFRYFWRRYPTMKAKKPLDLERAIRIARLMGFTEKLPQGQYYLQTLSLPKLYLEMPYQYHFADAAYEFHKNWGIPGYTGVKFPNSTGKGK